MPRIGELEGMALVAEELERRFDDHGDPALAQAAGCLKRVLRDLRDDDDC